MSSCVSQQQHVLATPVVAPELQALLLQRMIAEVSKTADAVFTLDSVKRKRKKKMNKHKQKKLRKRNRYKTKKI